MAERREERALPRRDLKKATPELGQIPSGAELDEAAIKTQVGKARVLIGLFSERVARWMPEAFLRPIATRWAKQDGFPSERIARYMSHEGQDHSS